MKHDNSRSLGVQCLSIFMRLGYLKYMRERINDDFINIIEKLKILTTEPRVDNKHLYTNRYLVCKT